MRQGQQDSMGRISWAVASGAGADPQGIGSRAAGAGDPGQGWPWLTWSLDREKQSGGRGIWSPDFLAGGSVLLTEKLKRNYF